MRESIPVLGQHINCTRVVRAVSDIKSFHLRHEVEEEASHPLLTFWKPEGKEKKKDQTH